MDSAAVSLREATDRNDGEELVRILGTLADEPVTFVQINSSGLLKAIKGLKKFSDRKVASEASRLWKSWKAGFGEGKATVVASRVASKEGSGMVKKVVRSSSDSSSSSSGSGRRDGAAAGGGGGSGGGGSGGGGSVEVSGMVEDAKALMKEVESARGKMRSKFVMMLQGNVAKAIAKTMSMDKAEAWAKAKCLKPAMELEDALFRNFGEGDATKGSEAYRQRLKSFLFNLSQNIELARELFRGPESYDEMATRPITELARKEVKEERAHAEEVAADINNLDWVRENQSKILDSVMGKGYVGAFKCSKCKSKNCDYFQLQTRSADEPLTTFVTCLNCGHQWKFN